MADRDLHRLPHERGDIVFKLIINAPGVIVRTDLLPNGRVGGLEIHAEHLIGIVRILPLRPEGEQAVFGDLELRSDRPVIGGQGADIVIV